MCYAIKAELLSRLLSELRLNTDSRGHREALTSKLPALQEPNETLARLAYSFFQQFFDLGLRLRLLRQLLGLRGTNTTYVIAVRDVGDSAPARVQRRGF